MAPAVGAVTVVIDTPVIVLVWLVVREVAPGAIRYIHRRLPVNRLGIAPVALSAVEVAPVIQWLIDQAEMLVDMWQPGIGHVTHIALLIGHEVPVVMAGRRVAVVTGIAGTKDLRMVNCRGGRPDRRGVTILADVCC